MQHLAPCTKTRFWPVIGLVIFAFIHTSGAGFAQTPETANTSEDMRTISPAGLGTKSKLAVGWLFYPKRLDSVVGLYAYPVGPKAQCYGSDIKGYQPAVGATAIILKGSDEEGYTSGQVWKASTATKHPRSVRFNVVNDQLCVETVGLDCKTLVGHPTSCLFLSERAINGATPMTKFWIDLVTNTFYMGKIEASMLPK